MSVEFYTRYHNEAAWIRSRDALRDRLFKTQDQPDIANGIVIELSDEVRSIGNIMQQTPVNNQ